MSLRENTIFIDIMKKNYQVLKFKQFDNNTPIDVHLLKNGVDANLKGYKAAAFIKTDKGVYQRDCSINNSIVSFNIDNNILSSCGEAYVEVTLYNGNTIETTFTLKLTIEKSLKGISVEEIPDWDIIKKLLDAKNSLIYPALKEIDKLIEELTRRFNELSPDQQSNLEVQLARANFKSLADRLANSDNEQKFINSKLSKIIANRDSIQYVEDSSDLRGMVTFVDDDGRDGTYERLKQICSEKGIPVVFALYKKSTITTEQALELQDVYGCEIAGHSMSHKFLHTLNEEQLEYELGDCKRMLIERGFNVNNFVYPQNTHNELVHKVARKYYNCACTIGEDGINKMENVTNFGLLRAALGTFAKEGKNNLDYYKSLVDKAKKEKAWLIFMTHVSWPTHGEKEQQDLLDTVQYCKDTGIDVVTLQRGWEFFGNKLELISTQGTTKVTNQGRILTTVVDRAGINAPNFNAPITEYEIGKKTITNFLAKDNTNFPGDKSGVLETYRNIYSTYSENSFQIWYPYNSNKMFKRRWLSNNSWGEWDEFAIATNYTSPNFDAPITEYELGRITTSNFVNDDHTNFPGNNAGVLETYRNKFKSWNGCSFQIWYPYNSNKMFKRRWDDDKKVWDEWDEFATVNLVDYKIAKSTLVQNVNSSSYISSAPISAYPTDKITVTIVPLNRASGFPNNMAGILTTYNLGGNGYSYQEYKEYADNRKWIRSTNPDGSWMEWIQY